MSLLEKMFGQPDTLKRRKEALQNPLVSLKQPEEYPNIDNIYNRAIKDLIPPIDTILGEIKPNVLQGQYGMLIGDDTSGRIPTLIFRGVINTMLEEVGKDKIPTFFIQSDHSRLPANKRKRLTTQIRSVSDKNAKALIITDYMKSGLHMQHICTLVRKSGYKFDIAAISRDEDEMRFNFFNNKGGDIFPSIPQTQKAPTIFNRPDLSGLNRHDIQPPLHHARKYVLKARMDVDASIEILSQIHT